MACCDGSRDQASTFSQCHSFNFIPSWNALQLCFTENKKHEQKQQGKDPTQLPFSPDVCHPWTFGLVAVRPTLLPQPEPKRVVRSSWRRGMSGKMIRKRWWKELSRKLGEKSGGRRDLTYADTNREKQGAVCSLQLKKHDLTFCQTWLIGLSLFEMTSSSFLWLETLIRLRVFIARGYLKLTDSVGMVWDSQSLSHLPSSNHLSFCDTPKERPWRRFNINLASNQNLLLQVPSAHNFFVPTSLHRNFLFQNPEFSWMQAALHYPRKAWRIRPTSWASAPIVAPTPSLCHSPWVVVRTTPCYEARDQVPRFGTMHVKPREWFGKSKCEMMRNGWCLSKSNQLQLYMITNSIAISFPNFRSHHVSPALGTSLSHILRGMGRELRSSKLSSEDIETRPAQTGKAGGLTYQKWSKEHGKSWTSKQVLIEKNMENLKISTLLNRNRIINKMGSFVSSFPCSCWPYWKIEM